MKRDGDMSTRWQKINQDVKKKMHRNTVYGNIFVLCMTKTKCIEMYGKEFMMFRRRKYIEMHRRRILDV